jgi:uncharacterized membrane protein YoaK (UPF0700 family)
VSNQTFNIVRLVLLIVILIMIGVIAFDYFRRNELNPFLLLMCLPLLLLFLLLPIIIGHNHKDRF